MSIDRTKYMSLAEVRQLCESASKKGGLTWMVVDMALMTGLRVGELAAIQKEHIDFDRKFLTITRLKKSQPKPENMALGNNILNHLRKYVNGRAGALFVGQRGALTAQGLQRIWKKAVKDAGIKPYSIHKARHTFATHHHAKHKNLRALQLLLGHAKVETTAKFYADVTFEDLQNSLNNLY